MNKRKLLKITFGILLFPVIILSAYFSGILVKYYLDRAKEPRAIERFQEALEKPYKEDIYGGKTPEETWAMFLDALKKGDIELASQYFVVEKQGEWRVILEDTIEAGNLENVLQSLQTLRLDEFNNDRTKGYYYRDVFNVNKEKRSSPVIFKLNPFTKIWKISNL